MFGLHEVEWGGGVRRVSGEPGHAAATYLFRAICRRSFVHTANIRWKLPRSTWGNGGVATAAVDELRWWGARMRSGHNWRVKSMNLRRHRGAMLAYSRCRQPRRSRRAKARWNI